MRIRVLILSCCFASPFLFARSARAGTLWIGAQGGLATQGTNDEEALQGKAAPQLGNIYPTGRCLEGRTLWEFPAFESAPHLGMFLTALYALRSYHSDVRENDALGQDLLIQTGGFGLGWERVGYGGSTLSLALLYTENFAAGHSEHDSLRVENGYEPSAGGRVELGWEYRFSEVGGFSLSARLIYDGLSLERGSVKFYHNDAYYGTLEPDGYVILPGNAFSLQLGLAYGFAFGR